MVTMILHPSQEMHFDLFSSADSEGGPDPPPPWYLPDVGSCIEASWVGDGVQRLFSPYYYQFFLARFANQYYTNILHV